MPDFRVIGHRNLSNLTPLLVKILEKPSKEVVVMEKIEII